MKIANNKLDVFYENRLVGHLILNDDFTTSFYYSANWLQEGFSISPFKLPLESREFRNSDYFSKNMFGVFYDCLPDSWGNRLVDKFLFKNGINPRKVNLLDRLTLLDQYSFGALHFKPTFAEKFEIDEIKEFDEFKAKLDEFIKEDKEIDINLYHKGSSTGGSRPKINYLIDNELYLVKFPGIYDSINIEEEEYRINQLARKCDINVAPSLLIKSNISKGYFASKRFDRAKGKRIHMISLAGLFDLDETLSQIHYLGFLQTTKALCPEDLNEALKRMIFNYLIGNKDDHPRNILYYYDEENKKYRLAPFFDITSTPNIKEHMMLVNNTSNPTLKDFVIEASKVGINEEIVITTYKKIKEIIANNF